MGESTLNDRVSEAEPVKDNKPRKIDPFADLNPDHSLANQSNMRTFDNRPAHIGEDDMSTGDRPSMNLTG